MKALYKIITVTRRIDKEYAKSLFKRLRGIRLEFAGTYKVSKEFGLTINIEGLRRTVQSPRLQFANEMSRHTDRYVQRIVNGRIFEAGIPNGKGGLEDALQDIRSAIRRERIRNKEFHDPLKSRSTGYYLKRYQDKALKALKYPTSNADFTGIEIECILPSNVDLNALLPFSKWINIGHDGSIDANEDDEEGREVRVCIEKDELRNVLPNLMATLQSLDARVNRSCGLHVHLDQRHAVNAELSFQKLVRSLGLLYTVVPRSRRSNTYCRRNRHANFQAARDGDRYKAINATSYDKYKTIEVRLFGGTLDATKIINWIEVLWAIVKGEALNRCPKNFDTALRYWKLSKENLAWLKARQEKFAALNALAPTTENDTDDYQPDNDDTDPVDYEPEEEMAHV